MKFTEEDTRRRVLRFNPIFLVMALIVTLLMPCAAASFQKVSTMVRLAKSLIYIDRN